MRSEGFAIFAAVALHGVILLVARSMPPLALLLPPDNTEMRRATEYEVEPELVAQAKLTPEPEHIEVSPDRPRNPVRAPETPGAAAAAAVSPRTAVSPSPSSAPTGEPQVPATGNPPPAGTEKPNWDDLPPDPKGVGGVPGGPGGPPVWVLPGMIPTNGPGAPAPTTAPAAREVDRRVGDRVLEEVMTARDKSMGIDLPAAGTVASAVATAVRSSDVPDVAKAAIEIRLGPGGNVLSVRVLSSVGGTADQWNRVVAAARAALMGRGLAMIGQYEKGATVTVNVQSNLQAPSGSKGGFTGSGAAFDVSNIGAHSTRHVRTSFSVATAH